VQQSVQTYVSAWPDEYRLKQWQLTRHNATQQTFIIFEKRFTNCDRTSKIITRQHNAQKCHRLLTGR